MPNKRARNKLLFLSHSSRDKDLADALLDLLCTALHIRKKDCLCTSVDGARLAVGATTDKELKFYINNVPAFLSLITPESLASTYVLFEMGARWGLGKYHAPLLANGASLRDPLKSLNALFLDHEDQVLQLTNDLAQVLPCELQPPHSFLDKVRKVVSLSSGTSPRERARALLRHCIAILAKATQLGQLELERALSELRRFQAGLNPALEQVSLVVDGTIRVHAMPELEGKPAMDCWKEEGSESSLFRTMNQGSGMMQFETAGYRDRLTTIAFNTDYNRGRRYTLVAEVHRQGTEKRLFGVWPWF